MRRSTQNAPDQRIIFQVIVIEEQGKILIGQRIRGHKGIIDCNRRVIDLQYGDVNDRGIAERRSSIVTDNVVNRIPPNEIQVRGIKNAVP